MMKFILFAVLTVCVVSAFAGPESGGGGNVCQTQSGLTALDLINGGGVYHAVRLYLRSADRVVFSAAEKSIGLKFLTPSPKLMRGVDIVLEDIASKQIRSSLRKSINDLKMIAVPRLPAKRALGADFRQTAPCDSSNTTAAIVYDWKTGLTVSAELWNQLDEANQVALLIHEGLRNIQIRYRYGFSNFALQRLTQDLMTGKAAEFERIYEKFRAQSPKTTAAAKARLCSSAKSRQIVSSLTAWVENNADKKPVDPKRLLSTYFTAACASGRTEDIWNLIDFMLSDLDMENMWSSWGISDSDFDEYNKAITNAYFASFSRGPHDLDKTWEDVRYSRVIQWAAPVAFDGQALLTKEDAARFWARIKDVYAEVN